MSFDYHLFNLKRLQSDSEKQMLEFNEIVPFEHNPKNVYSPRLVNLILQIGPQIENITDLIVRKLQLKPQGSGTPSRIKKINETGILSKLKIISIPHRLQFTPFTFPLKWWEEDYQKTKHDLSKFQFEVTYSGVMNSLSALAGLHKLADTITISDKQNTLDKILDPKNWKDYQLKSFGSVSIIELEAGSPIWQSLVFSIPTYYIHARQRNIMER